MTGHRSPGPAGGRTVQKLDETRARYPNVNRIAFDSDKITYGKLRTSARFINERKTFSAPFHFHCYRTIVLRNRTTKDTNGPFSENKSICDYPSVRQTSCRVRARLINNIGHSARHALCKKTKVKLKISLAITPNTWTLERINNRRHRRRTLGVRIIRLHDHIVGKNNDAHITVIEIRWFTVRNSVYGSKIFVIFFTLYRWIFSIHSF